MTPAQAAAYMDRAFLGSGPPVTEDDLAAHADKYGPHLVAETAWTYGLRAPVPPADAPRPDRRKRR